MCVCVCVCLSVFQGVVIGGVWFDIFGGGKDEEAREAIRSQHPNYMDDAYGAYWSMAKNG